jgi:hypothetical protein
MNPEDPAMQEYYGYGWSLGNNTLVETSPRKKRTFADLPANHELHYLWKYANGSYVAAHKLNASASLTISFLGSPTGYTAQTFVPAGNLVLGFSKPYMVAIPAANVFYFTSSSHGLLKISGGNVTQVTGATTLRTVVQHLSRLVGISTDNNQARIQYSVPGK